MDIKPKLVIEHKGKNLIPKVYSEFVFKICGALMIEAELSPMKKSSNWIGKLNRKSRKKSPPVVHSVVVYKICVALNLRAQLCPVTTINASICNTQQKPKKRKEKHPQSSFYFCFQHLQSFFYLEAVLASS
ncbi:hypothetical protein TNCT_227261 [Trichonephila clavata]|nr:hypothetical protein TNCT_227261 [Trichonephila clavata]